MIHQEKCYMATCDNCGEIFNDGEYSMFPLESDVEDRMRNDSEWFAGYGDPDHKGKHYCFDCYKYHPEIDDKIIVDLSRKKESATTSAPSNVQGVEETAQNYAKGQCWQCRKDGSMDEPCLCSTLERAFIAGSQSQVDISGLEKQLIGFAEWMDNRATQIESGIWCHAEKGKEFPMTTKELLQQYRTDSGSQSNSPAKGKTLCVFCEMECEPAPTKRGWSSVRSGYGLHFDCAGKVADQGNAIDLYETGEIDSVKVEEKEANNLPKNCKDKQRGKNDACKYPIGTCQSCANIF